MDVQSTRAILVAYLTWIAFQLSQSSMFHAHLRIKKGYNISLFELDSLVGYECGSLASGLYRDPNIDTTRKTDCPYAVQICIPDCDYAKYSTITNVKASRAKDLASWIKADTVHGFRNKILSVSLIENGFDLVLNKSSSLTQAAVYNPGPPHLRPRFFFAIPDDTGGEPISNIFNADRITKFQEYTRLEVQYSFFDTCTKLKKFITKKTCHEALEEAKISTSPEPTTTVQPLTSGNKELPNVADVGLTTQAASGSFWNKLYPDSQETKATKPSSIEEVMCVVQCQSGGYTFANIEPDKEKCICGNSDPHTKGNVWKRNG